MEAYTDFAEVYDIFMDNAPYAAWCDFLEQTIQKYGISKPQEAKDILESEKNLVLDLGCGTGTLTRMLAKKGYDMIGVDNSADMLRVAEEKKNEEGLSILYLLQDMREFELYSTVGTVFSVCDSLNYILEEEELSEVFALVQNYLFPGGLFVFDFNTDYKYAEVIGDTTIAENRDECSFIWENYYDREACINEYDLTVFVKEGDLYRKFNETHYQRGYTAGTMQKLAEGAGLELLFVMDADTREEISAVSERICMAFRKKENED